MKHKEKVKAVAYIRTSSAANVGADKDSEKRQRAAIEAFAKRSGFVLKDEFSDPGVSGADSHRNASWVRFSAGSDRGQWRAHRYCRGCLPVRPQAGYAGAWHLP
jgi:hypothetical protein